MGRYGTSWDDMALSDKGSHSYYFLLRSPPHSVTKNFQLRRLSLSRNQLSPANPQQLQWITCVARLFAAGT